MINCILIKDSGSSGGEECEKDEIRSEKVGKEKEDFGEIEMKEEEVKESKKKENFVLDIFGGAKW